MDRVSRALVRTGILDQMVGLIPGFRDLLLGGKIFEIDGGLEEANLARCSAR